MIQGESIVVFANDWHSDPTSKHQIVKILSVKNRILWVNSVGLRNPSLCSGDMLRMLRKLREVFRGPEKVNGNLNVITPLVLPFHKHRLIRRLNRILLLGQIKAYIVKKGMKKVQLWTFIPTMIDVAGVLGQKKLIYYCVDDWSKFTFVNQKSVLQMENELIRKSDVVITSARELYEQKRRMNRNTHLVPHGVDYAHFSKALDAECRIPDDVQKIRKPIVGFFGLIHEWIDLELLKAVAQSHAEWSLVMIGKVSVDVRDIAKLANVYFLGQKQYEDLPGYCKAFDVGMIPFILNDLTKSVNPIKLREYLAAGLPVVSVNLPEVQFYSNLVKIGRDVEEFISQIELALGEGGPKQRQNRSLLMAGEDWGIKMEKIGQLTFSSK